METSCSRFTPAEGGARLAVMAGTRNTLAVEYTSFIATRLLHEEAYQIRGFFTSGRKRSVYVTLPSRVPCVSYELSILTDLAVATGEKYDDVEDWADEVERKEVIVCTSSVLKKLLEQSQLQMERINVLVLDSCHRIYVDECLQYIMRIYKECDEVNLPRILALTYPLFGPIKKDVDIKDTKETDTLGEKETGDVINNETGDKTNDLKVNDNDIKELGKALKRDTQTEDVINNVTDDKTIHLKDKVNDNYVKDAKNYSLEETQTDGVIKSEVEENISDSKDKLNDKGIKDLGEDEKNDSQEKDTLVATQTDGVIDEANDSIIDIKDIKEDTTETTKREDVINHETEAKNDINDSMDKDIKVKGKDTKEDSLEELQTDGVIKNDIEEITIDSKDIDDKDIKEDLQENNSAEDKVLQENRDDFKMYENLEWRIEELEKELCCQMDLAEDIDGGKRLSTSTVKPKELIIEYATRPLREAVTEAYIELDNFMRTTIKDALDFMHEHRHDPTEIYGEELYEEFMNIPDPTLDPKHIFHQFLYVLDELGPYAADKAAFTLLSMLEKLKIKIPYERHFLLLCLSTTVLVKIRCSADLAFSKCSSEWQKIEVFSNPKVLRFAEILQKFQPPEESGNDCGDSKVGDDKHGIDDVNKEEMIKTDELNVTEGKGYVSDKIDGNIEDISHTNELNISKAVDEEKSYVSDKIDGNIEDISHTNEFNINTDTDISKEVNKEKNNDFDKIASNKNDSNIKELMNQTNELNMNINKCKDDTEKNNDGDKIDGHTKENTSHINELNNIDSNKSKEVNEEQRSHIDTKTKLINVIENCDFISLCNTLEDKVNSYEANLKDLDIDVHNTISDTNKSDSNENNMKIGGVSHDSGRKNDLSDNLNTSDSNKSDKKSVGHKSDSHKSDKNTSDSSASSVNKSDSQVLNSKVDLNTSENSGKGIINKNLLLPSPGRVPSRSRRAGRRRAPQPPARPDALCAVLYTRDPLLAKILFMLLVDMSRHGPCLSYVSAQYCTEPIESPALTEPNETQRRGRQQEDVLKKFRMHECNLLLATSALEEGIDLPRCNLVLRWDLPPNYRSYGLCRGRARAPRASTAILCPVEDTHPTGPTSGPTGPTRTTGPTCPTGPTRPTRLTDPPKPDTTEVLLHNVATYRELDQIITRKCGCGIQDEPPPSEEEHADNFTPLIRPYTPNDKVNLKDSPVNENNRMNEDNSEYNPINDNDNNINENENKINEIDNTINENDNTINRLDTKSKDPNNTSKVVNFKADVFGDDDELTKSDDNIMKYDDLKVNNDTDSETDIEESLTEMDINKHNDNEKTDTKLTIKSDTKVTSDIKSDIAAGISKQSNDNKMDNIASVDLTSAIALINRYCGKLPSDTFTRLAPQWKTEEVCLPTADGERTAYICTLRLPLNCPVKYNIVGHPMPTRVLARRMVALQACRILHKSGELDNQLMPIGKENFKALELESAFGCGQSEHGDPNDTARPGTTKRRQYYYKRTALAFTDCQPIVDSTDAEISQTLELNPAENNVKSGTKRNMLYAIVSKLWCALPERYNTRGRRLHAPQNAKQAIGILMARREADSLQIPAFPVYTRSGEVRVSVEYVPDADVRVSPTRGRLIRRFMRFVFSSVLRVRRRGMRLNTDGSTHNNYYVVPTIKSTRQDGTTKIDIDWAFLELIYQHTEQQKLTDMEKPNIWQNEEEDELTPAKVEKKGGVLENPLLKDGETFVFDAEKYREAVVTPWYRNQDQPQFFLVAEICNNLTPDSAFPSASHTSFRKYYNTKYRVVLTQPNQPLLDVDHTSARLNLLTPRYVNRKGVALPVSSERTRRAKRDRLDQKQMLVPELCRLHPFAAPLWFATVALPCVLYRINALLIADEIRCAVAIDVGLGIPKIDETTCPDFQWPPLDFGWSLAEVLSADSEKGEKKKDDEDSTREGDVDTKEKEGIDNPTTDKDGELVKEECKEKTINDILQEKEAQTGFEIGTWSNDMASSIPPEEDDYMEPLPSNLTFCTSASGGANWCDPVEKPKSLFNPTRSYSMADSDCSYLSSDFDTDDSDLDTEGSDDDTDTSGFYSGRNSNGMGVRIEYKTAREAEAVDEPRKPTIPTPSSDPNETASDIRVHKTFFATGEPPLEYKEKFHKAVLGHKQDIVCKKHLIKYDEAIGELLPEASKDPQQPIPKERLNIQDIFPYGTDEIKLTDGQITLESIERNKRVLLSKLKQKLPHEKIKEMTCFSMKDVDIDSPDYVNEKISNVGFDTSKTYEDRIRNLCGDFKPYYQDSKGQNGKEFDFDYQPNLEGHPGPSPSVILQALTMSNANDGINLERLETIGDSFLKFAITAYLYCGHPTVHEGKLSHMRSKQVSNLNLYRLGRNKRLGARMIASKFEPHDNWLPPCHKPPNTLHPRNAADSQEQPTHPATPSDGANTGCFIPYNLITQHSIPDKSIADCVEALIGAYLLECGPRGALLFMSWLGIRVLPRHDIPLPTDHPYVKAAGTQKSPPPSPKRPLDPPSDSSLSWEDCSPEDKLPEHWPWPGRPVGSLRPYKLNGQWIQPIFGELKAPPSPLLRYIEDPEGELEQMLSGYEALERTLQYRFRDRSLLLQALTHASHHRNRLTDCYQRLEFLGDAILDYLITRHLYEDPRRHSPGALTDLRSALVNNTIFATLAARHGFHKYFRHMSPGLNEVLTKYVKIQEENGHSISEEHYLIQEDEMEQAEDVEVPKALGDLFESIAGAIFLDSGMSLGAVWRSYVNLMGAELEAFSAAAPKSPVRELLEAEPDTAKFGKPERLADGRRVRVCVEVFGRGQFKGIGRNYRIAKGTAARCALRHLRIHRAR